ncbi:transcription repressor NadR [Dolosigranulum pigrum]|uniref:transcription repressor NadR n=1 Tax=Dolosigranulum pigrum TaxID=29394 RepID=UPI001AD85FB6|nr:transcription repressor NadR [Dolosigranulum pigrum]QTJ58214.1 transcription repressor NadR [Dolosigranulum pigrum]
MNAKQRREKIIALLTHAVSTITASQLADEFGVSRQIIVSDIAVLRAKNYDITSTNRGYRLTKNIEQATNLYKGKVAVQHTAEQTFSELHAIINAGGILYDIQIDHPVYGLITAPLHIEHPSDINHFMEDMSHQKGELLSSLTNGVHIHTIGAKSPDHFATIKAALDKLGILVDEQ